MIELEKFTRIESEASGSRTKLEQVGWLKVLKPALDPAGLDSRLLSGSTWLFGTAMALYRD